MHRKGSARRRAAQIALAILSSVVGGLARADTVTHTDDTFAAADWTQTVVLDSTTGPGASRSATQATSGGNPGAWRRSQFLFSFGASGEERLVLGSVRRGVTHDPASQGAIRTLSFGFDYQMVSQTGGTPGADFGFLLVQDGTVYWTNTLDAADPEPPQGHADGVPTAGQWATLSVDGLDAGDFRRLSPAGPEFPDFSVNGGSLEFGTYHMVVSAAGETANVLTTAGVDNWSVTLDVNPVPAIDAATLPEWTEGRPLVLDFTATGGTPPLAWSLALGALPTDDPIDGATGRLSGNAKSAGTYDFTLKVTDSLGQTATRAFSQRLNAAPSAVAGLVPPLAIGRPYAKTPDVAGGTAPFTWSVTTGELPGGLSLDAGTGAIAGTPEGDADLAVALSVTDAAGAVASAEVSTSAASRIDLAKRKATERVQLQAGAVQTPIDRFVELTRGARLSLDVRGGGSATQTAPLVSLIDGSGAEIDLGALRRVSRNRVRVPNYVAPSTGRSFLRVAPAEDSVGSLTSLVTVRPAAQFVESVSLPGAGGVEVGFAAPPGARVTIVATASGPGARAPRVVSVVGPDGGDLVPGGTARSRGRSVTFTSRASLAGGDHTLRLEPSDGAPAEVRVVVKLRLPTRYEFQLTE